MGLPPSPFVVGPPLRSDEPIFGREDAFDFVHASLQRYESVNLVGERHMGKTSLLHHLLGHPQPGTERLLVEVDLQANVTAAADFYGRAVRGILADPRAQAAVPRSAASLQRLQAQPQADFAEFERLLRRLRDAKVRPVLLVDELERLLEPQFAAGFPFPVFFDGLRSLITADLLALVVASRLTLAEHFERHPAAMTSTFPCYLKPFTLRELDPAAADSLLLQGKDCGIGLLERQRARDWAGGHPCRLQCAGQAWVEAKAGKHDAVWARRRFRELAGQACLARSAKPPVGFRMKRAGRWLAKGPRWVCVDLPTQGGRWVKRIGDGLSTVTDWLLGLLVALGLLAALLGWRDVLDALIGKLQDVQNMARLSRVGAGHARDLSALEARRIAGMARSYGAHSFPSSSLGTRPGKLCFSWHRAGKQSFPRRGSQAELGNQRELELPGGGFPSRVGWANGFIVCPPKSCRIGGQAKRRLPTLHLAPKLPPGSEIGARP